MELKNTIEVPHQNLRYGKAIHQRKLSQQSCNLKPSLWRYVWFVAPQYAQFGVIYNADHADCRHGIE